jgi:hypothetical protein
MALTADDFLAKVQLRIGYDPSPKLTSADLLSIADDVLTGDLWPMLISQHGDYYRHALDIDITADQRRYRLPIRAHGPIADVLYVDDQGIEFSIDAMDPEDIGHQGNRFWPPVDTITPGPNIFTHYIEGDFIYLYPTPTVTTGTLRIKYYRRPNALCLATAARQWQFYSTAETIRLNSTTLPASGFSDLSRVDLISLGNAHQVVGDGLQISTTGTVATLKTLVFVAGSLGSLEDELGAEFQPVAPAVGVFNAQGWVAPYDQTPVVMAPSAMMPLVIARTAQDALDAIGDASGFQRAMERTQRLEAASVPERSKAEPKYTAVRNSPFRMR